ncbi:MAG: polyprenyl diphosphate synthase [Natronomonas sp.]
MRTWLRHRIRDAYLRMLTTRIEETPRHVAVIQDGNRRYASRGGDDVSDGHRAGAETTEQILRWCNELDIDELTLYAFSTENFKRPPDEQERIFDLIEQKLLEFADDDQVHSEEVRIRALGEIDRLPQRVIDAVEYAEAETAGYDRHRLNIALAYGGRNELMRTTREIAQDVASGTIDPESIDVDEIEGRLYHEPVREVDLIIRTGGDERTSNFLPWYANGNEAAVFFCTPYWPEFSKTDFLRALRTYEAREESWQRSRAERAIALIRSMGELELEEANRIAARLRDRLPPASADRLDAELERGDPQIADGEPSDD